MKRNIVTDAVVLRTSPFGEIHKSVTLFTRDHGILHAVAYGALKGTGKLRSAAAPFTYGTVYLYNEPVKGSWKITDFDAKDFFVPLRENLRSYFSASLWAELILGTHAGGGGSEEVFDFFMTAFRSLSESGNDLDTTFCSIQFIWRYLDMLGIRPATDTCARCENPVPESDDLAYSNRESGFVCSNCRDVVDPRIGPGSRKYLEYTSVRPFREAVKVRLAQEAAPGLKRLMFSLAEGAVDRPLNSLRSGEGIL